ncbi:MAG: hypothetical protein QXY94_02565 [Archaeoglobaceae archaeon]
MGILPLLIISGLTAFITSQISKKINKPVKTLGEAFSVISNTVAQQLFAQANPISFIIGIVVQGIGNLIASQMNIEQQIGVNLNNSIQQLDAFTQAIANAIIQNQQAFSDMVQKLVEDAFTHAQDLEQRRRDFLIELEDRLRPSIETNFLDIDSTMFELSEDLTALTRECLSTLTLDFDDIVDFRPKLDLSFTDAQISVSSIESTLTNAISSQIFKAEELVPTLNEITMSRDHSLTEKALERFFTYDEETIYERLKTYIKVYSRLQIDALKEMQSFIEELRNSQIRE